MAGRPWSPSRVTPLNAYVLPCIDQRSAVNDQAILIGGVWKERTPGLASGLLDRRRQRQASPLPAPGA
jgi:hypothetical protein